MNNKKSWKLFWLGLALAIPMGFQNCTPSQFNNTTADAKKALSSSSLATASCDNHASGTRWWELDPVSENSVCPGGSIIQLRYYSEKLCNNGVTSTTGQRVADSTNPVCQTVCQSTTAAWNAVEGQIQQTVSCSGNTTASEVHERLVQYTCVNNTPRASGQIMVGNKISGGCASNPASNPCVNSVTGATQAEGTIWQEPTTALTYAQACTSNTSASAQYSCERFFEYQCLNSTKQLTTREVVIMNCNATTTCPSSAGSCSTETGTYANLATWSKRISPDFVDPGNCANGGDLSITSERLQTYSCNNGAVIPQQVVRGSEVSHTGSCGPRDCTVSHGSGRQQWTTVNGTAQWGACVAETCDSGYELLQAQCLKKCSSGQVRNSISLVCQTPVCASGAKQSCSVANGAGEQSCNSDRMGWGSCNMTSCNAGYVAIAGSCVLKTTIRISTADYGHNFGFTNNATAHMASVCNDKYSCSYYISTGNLGDPKTGWSKDFYVVYDCNDGVTRTGYANPEANTSTITISCPAQ